MQIIIVLCLGKQLSASQGILAVKVKERNFITSGVINLHLCHWLLLVLFVLSPLKC